MNLRHFNGRPACTLYGAHPSACGPETTSGGSFECFSGAIGQGAVVAFNLQRADGSWVGYRSVFLTQIILLLLVASVWLQRHSVRWCCREVETLAGLNGIMLRTGCFCNPGACAAALGLTGNTLRANFEAGHICWDDQVVFVGHSDPSCKQSHHFFADANVIC